MINDPERLKRLATAGFVAGLACVCASVAAAAQDKARSGEASAVTKAASRTSAGGAPARYGPETVRVYRSVGPDGRVTFGDQPQPGATTVQIRSFASSSDEAAMATAAAQRAYWREQSAAFANRRAQREAAERRAERERFESDPSGLYVIPYHLRPSRPAPVGRYPATYGAGPGLASGTPSGFLSSGFADSGR